ncbi:MAG TPA: Gfo/Idh/MocA family oxidoreductase [Fimbriimonadaceae bacterium]|nr:Gfo/Idh/MocA family oxidoreductase [Fimbriimonadaceae bacterium]
MPLNWGILTAGSIAGAFAAGLNRSTTGTLVATGARDLDRSKAFAAAHGGRAYGSYEEVLRDPDVEAVYIATPHHLHAEWTVKAAEAGKAVLCEKPFTLNYAEAQAALEAVRANKVFFMEAFMYRCSPQMKKFETLIRDGAIGRILSASVEFSYFSGPDRVNFRTERTLGGGGIMDVGTYCTSFGTLLERLVTGHAQVPVRVEYSADLTRGYDSHGAGILAYPSGLHLRLASGVHLAMRNGATVYGEEGWIDIDDPWKCPIGSTMTLQRIGSNRETFELGCDGTDLYRFEADVVAGSIKAGEAPEMPIADTVVNMKTLDAIRQSCGLTFN